MGYNNLASKLRKAALAVVTPAVASITLAGHTVPTTFHLYNALQARRKRAAAADSETEKELPCATFRTEDGQEIVKTLGNERIPLVITIESAGDADTELDDDDPEANHDAWVQAVLDALMDDGAAASLSAAVADFTVLDIIDMGAVDAATAEQHFATAHRFDVVCVPSSV